MAEKKAWSTHSLSNPKDFSHQNQAPSPFIEIVWFSLHQQNY